MITQPFAMSMWKRMASFIKFNWLMEEVTYNGIIYRSVFTKAYELYISNYLLKIWMMVSYEKRQAIKKLLRGKG